MQIQSVIPGTTSGLQFVAVCHDMVPAPPSHVDVHTGALEAARMPANMESPAIAKSPILMPAREARPFRVPT